LTAKTESKISQGYRLDHSSHDGDINTWWIGCPSWFSRHIMIGLINSRHLKQSGLDINLSVSADNVWSWVSDLQSVLFLSK
jgi:hypothetical protein